MRIEQKLSFPIFFIIIGNILTGIIKSSPVTDLVLYIVPFIILIFLLFFKVIKLKNTTMSILLLLFSCLAMFQEDITALNDVAFFALSLYISVRSKKTYLIYGGIYSILLLSRYTLTGMSPSEIITHLSGISFILIIYQHYMHPKKVIKEDVIPDYLISPVKKDIVDTIRLIILGYQYNEINDKLELSITDDQVRRNVNKEVKRLGFRNREHMIFFLTEKGIIKSISCDLDINDKSHDSL